MKNKSFIPLSVPNICGNELKYVIQAVEEQWVSTAGGNINRFEEKMTEYLSIEAACACQSGTAGLHLCLRHFGIGKGDIVLVPTLTFIATINAVMYEAATPVFFDCEDNLGINVKQIKEYLEKECEFDGVIVREKKSGALIKAIVPVHVFGDTCNMDEIMKIATKYKLIVIEDATEALGTKFSYGKYEGMYAGTVGHAGVFSFNGNKIITTGGGGMIVSNNIEDIRHMKYLSQQAKDDVIYFEHNEVGYNYRMTNIQAALGLGQLEQLEEFIQIKKKNFGLYRKMLKTCEFGKLLEFKEKETANYWFYTFQLTTNQKDERDRLIKYLQDNNIQVRPIWKLNHTQKPFESFRTMSTSQAEYFYDTIINLPCSSSLTEEQVKVVCKVLLAFK